MSHRYVCIHGHFYQPPRENPWLEAIESQDSAAPYHDWNERITDECYRPNAQARVVDHEGWLIRSVNNYARMSFNFGPTLLSWLQDHAPDVHDAIVEADRLSKRIFGGHGSAMAQCYNHMIMPLATPEDRRTQVRWGVEDFRSRFGRRPEGMWLPETAACVDSLEALAEEGITFTVLAPRQAGRFRRVGEEHWRDCAKHGIDPSRAYVQRLPSGRTINLFFYDGPVSQAVAFERLLDRGETFAGRITDALPAHREGPALAHIATDGETYGHHHRYGEMALAYVLTHFEHRDDVKLTNYAQFLELHPPEHEVEIIERSSWSCVHGVGRWMEDCGCHTGGHGDWNQRWRKHLRESLDELRERIDAVYDEHASKLFKDPSAARDGFISVLLDRSDATSEAFLAEHASHELSEQEDVAAHKLLELQRHAMLMYTSCGWFFDDLAGIETVQVLRYAARAVQLAAHFSPDDIEGPFLSRLAEGETNSLPKRNGRELYEQTVMPSVIDLTRVGAHYAVASLFFDDGSAEPAGDGPIPESEDVTSPSSARIYCYDVDAEDVRRWDAGRSRLQIGHATLRSRITRDSNKITFAVLHLGDHVINGGARPYASDVEFDSLAERLSSAFEVADFGAILRHMEHAFGTSHYSLSSLFHDEQRRIAGRILESTVGSLDHIFRRLHSERTPLMRFLGTLNLPLPRSLLTLAEFVINDTMAKELDADEASAERLDELVEEAHRVGARLDHAELAHRFESALHRLAVRAASGHGDPNVHLRAVAHLGRIAPRLPFGLNIGASQLIIHGMIERLAARVSETPSATVGVPAPVDLAALKAAADAVLVRWPTAIDVPADEAPDRSAATT